MSAIVFSDAKRKKLLMYVYGDITTDARVNRAACALAESYDITLLSTNFGKVVEDGCYKNILIGNSGTGIKNLLDNIFYAYKIIKRDKPDVLYCHDYFSSILASLCVGKKYCKHIIYDAHELIIPEPGLKDRRQSVFYLFEKHIVNKVDLVICASIERCQQMVQHYNLKHVPVVIRNISQLSINDDEQTLSILESLQEFFSTPELTVVYAGVVTKNRKIQDLVSAVAEQAHKYKLLIVGNGNAIESIKEIAASYPELKSFFTGSVPYKSLGAILSRCDMGFVYYPTNTLNNRFCASNKIYEYASVALPMIANENPTIKAELDSNSLGIASNDLKSAILKLSDNLQMYREACVKYTKSNPWQKDANLLLESVNQISNRL